jgi:hypothetical protein
MLLPLLKILASEAANDGFSATMSDLFIMMNIPA